MARLHAVDPGPVEAQLADLSGVATDLGSMLDGLGTTAKGCHRTDLADAVGRLVDQRPPVTPPVICHGDLHPFNLLVEVAGWVEDGSVGSRGGHPWLVCGDAFAARLTAVTGVPVRPR